MAARGITYDDILRDLKAQKIAPVYYLMGEEDYYIDKLSDAIVDAVLTKDERDFNLDVVYGAEVNIDKVIELAHAYPMMAERRVVLVREAQAIRSLDGLEAYLEHLTPTTVLVFCHKHGKLDMRKAAAKVMQQVGVVFESKRLYENQLAPFISRYFSQHQVDIEPQAIQMLAGHVGADLSRLTTEMDKLLLALPAGNRVVKAVLVEEQTGMSKDFNDFELQAALAQRNIFRANQIVKYYQSNPRSFFITKTLTNLFTFFSDVMLSYYAPDKTDAGIAAWLGKTEWKVRQDIGPARRNYSGVKVMQILGEIRKTDAKSKGVGGDRIPQEELLQDLIFFILH
ncbi:MAG: DNA polymerase III subunit delta [Bacteroidaceae bacterium]|nr:DNA polymerase III subunit delta [Bacteroidaceae bacterium]MBQ9170958.1 DNA polymerase III subunit delta [Bacteroidaceae bacterium]MBQ9293948.1 DNA polymerase III subunit delta [Bacteroidaceae bacterium]